jgi:hypothetical protein
LYVCMATRCNNQTPLSTLSLAACMLLLRLETTALEECDGLQRPRCPLHMMYILLPCRVQAACVPVSRHEPSACIGEPKECAVCCCRASLFSCKCEKATYLRVKEQAQKATYLRVKRERKNCHWVTSQHATLARLSSGRVHQYGTIHPPQDPQLEMHALPCLFHETVEDRQSSRWSAFRKRTI